MQELLSKLMIGQNFDSLAVAVINFKNDTYDTWSIDKNESSAPLYFDLASLTKPLTNSAIKLKYPEYFNKDLDLLLNHKAGLPLGGRLSKIGWQEQILNYEIKDSETLYSDYSSLRLMLELEKKSGKTIEQLCRYYFDEEMCYWFEIPEYAITPDVGLRNHKKIAKEVHDDNCFNLKKFVSHAGLFATVDGISKSLINLNKSVNMIDQLKKEFTLFNHTNRFVMGFDHPQDLENTLAGKGCSKNTFGHLGFTGTSFWIDTEKSIGYVILTNATQKYWYSREGLSHLRKSIGSFVWTNY